MKKITSLLVFGLALLLSCEKEGPTTVNEITDLYTVPAGASTMTFSSGKSTWSTDRRYFDLSFGNDLTTTLVGYDAFLTPGQYVLGGDEIGKAILAKTKVNGKTPESGYILVNNRDGKYTFIVSIDGEVKTWSGTLPFVADPAPKALTQVLSAQGNVANGTNSVTMNLATDGISQEFDMTTYQNVWKGEGGYLALDLYSNDGYLHDGTYKASAQGGAINAGEFGIGWDPGDLYGIGWVLTDWGTCWWDVKDGAATATKITDGLVTVSSREETVDDKDVTIWTISWGVNYPVEILFEGAIPALTKPKKPDGPVVPDHLYEDQVTPGETFDVHAVTITDKDKNVMAYLELLTEPGATDLSGSYPATSYAGQPGQMRDGYDGGSAEFNGQTYTWDGGGSYYMENGEQKYLYANTATVEVTPIATGAYTFSCAFFNYNAAGPDYVSEEGGEEDDDVTGDVVLKLTSGLTYSMEDVTDSNTSSDGSALSGMTLWRVKVSDASGTVAAFDLGTAAGSTDLAGTYEVMSYPDAVGKAGNGWGYPAYNFAGGCYFAADGAYYFIPSGATFTVTNKSDGSIKIKFQGAIQKDDYTDGGQGGLLLDNIAKS